MMSNPPGSTRPQFLAPYSANHMRVRRVRGLAKLQTCEDCGGQARDWAVIHGEDAADPMSYRPLCRKCHYAYDQETQLAGAVKRSNDPVWQAKRAALPRDSSGRYTYV